MDIYKGLMDIIPEKYLKTVDDMAFLPNPFFDFQRMDSLDMLTSLDKDDYDKLSTVCNQLGIIWQDADYLPVAIIVKGINEYIGMNPVSGKGAYASIKRNLKDYFEITSKLSDNREFLIYDEGWRFDVYPDDFSAEPWLELVG